MKLKYDKLLSNLAFKCKVRHYRAADGFDVSDKPALLQMAMVGRCCLTPA